jgi:hypothetical protein
VAGAWRPARRKAVGEAVAAEEILEETDATRGSWISSVCSSAIAASLRLFFGSVVHR